MNGKRSIFVNSMSVSAAIVVAMLGLPALAQEGRPLPQTATPQAQPAKSQQPSGGGAAAQPPVGRGQESLQVASRAAAATAVTTTPTTTISGRRAALGGPVILAFDDVSVQDTIPFIVETTGKIVMPIQPTILKNKRVTLINDTLIDRAKALDMLFEAFKLNSIGVVEKEEVIIIDMIENMSRHGRTELLGPDERVTDRVDTGVNVIKVFQIKKVDAETVHEILQDYVTDNATLSVDLNSNKILLHGDMGLAQQMQHIIDEVDHIHVLPVMRTFNLAYADAQAVADNIFELFESSGDGGQRARPQPTRNQPRAGRPQQPGQQPTGVPTIGPEIELKVTVNVPMNSVTVQSDPKKMEQISRLIFEDWDLPRSTGTSRVYLLEHTDPLKMRDILQELLNGSGGGAGGGGARRAGGAQAPGGGQQSSVAQIVGGIYSIDAFADKNALVVLSKTEDALDFLDDLIVKLDQPSDVGMPVKVELKHANAIQLAEELNALLAPSGASVSIQRPDQGLTGAGIGDDTGAANQAPSTGGGAAGGQMTFPWQRNQDEGQSEPTSLIGKVRVVPIVRENALAVIAPPAERYAVIELIKTFDRPGRQVMIEAIIAEVDLTDDLQYGVRFSAGNIALSNPDASIGATLDSTNEADNVFSIFDTSVLNFDFSANIVLQALAQITNVRILQEPRVFTADNQEARFFDGQNLPFQTGSTTTTGGNLQVTLDYKDVGVVLNVRPRITVERDVDLDVNLELSSVVPGVQVFGSAVLDKTETTTQVILKDGQTIVIGGILSQRESKITRKIPLLGDIPLLGELFKSKDNSTTTSELLVFLTPHVIDNPSENYKHNEPYVEQLKVMTGQLGDVKLDADTMEKIRKRIIPADQLPPGKSVEGPVDVEDMVDQPQQNN